jgi:hypothetical protein
MSELNPCVDCGNTFIECFGHDGARFGEGWWVGCKPCSKRDGGKAHFHTHTRAEGVEKWNAANPDSTSDAGAKHE